MGFDISNLGTYVQNGQGYAMKAVASAPTAAKLISSGNAQFGVKGSAAILKLNSDISLIKNDSCGRTGGSSIALSNKNITVVPLTDEANLCPKTLWSTFYSDSLAKGQAPAEELLPAFAQAIMEDRAAKLAAVNEKLLWQGDTSLTGTTNYKHIDGIAKQVTGSTTATGSTIVEKLQNFFINNDVDVRNQDDFVIAIGEDKYAEYRAAVFNNKYFTTESEFNVVGTTAKFHVTSGLNGVGKVIGTRLSNLQIAMDGQSDADNASLDYSKETKQFYMDFQYALGVAVVWAEEAKYATI